jgi:exodeoxyribonuclease VIII
MQHIPPHIIPARVLYDGIEALNYSGSKELLKSPAHYIQYMNREREATKALRVGSYVHALVLDKPKAETAFAIAPVVDRRTKDGKAAYEAFTSALQPGTTVLSADEADESMKIAAAALGCIDRHGFKFKATEFMFMTTFMDANIKAAIDAVGESDGYLYDLKTCEDASPSGFLKAVRAYRYNLQANFYKAAYTAGFKEHVQGFRFICVEKETLQTAVYELGPDLMAYGYSDFIKAVETYKACLASNDWPGYSQEIQTLDLNKAPTDAPAPITFA